MLIFIILFVTSSFHLYATENQSREAALYNYGMYYHSTGQFDKACNAFKHVVNSDSHHERACSKLRLHALRTQQWDDAIHYGLEPYWWYETDITNKKILFTSQRAGIGDIVQFLRYIKRLHQAGAYTIVEVPAYLHKMLSLCPFIDKIVLPNSSCAADLTLRISTPELMLTMHNTLQEPSTDVPYLYANTDRVAYWKQYLASDTQFKIGLCWHSSVVADKNGVPVANPRSIPLSCFAPLFTCDMCSFYSLQIGPGAEQLLSTSFPIHTFDKTFDRGAVGPFGDTLAIMQHLDLVITVDTSIAHIAGALGIPVWVILPVCSDFRWLLNTDTSPWYPSMKLFRQKTHGNWTAVFDEIHTALRQLII